MKIFVENHFRQKTMFKHPFCDYHNISLIHLAFSTKSQWGLVSMSSTVSVVWLRPGRRGEQEGGPGHAALPGLQHRGRQDGRAGEETLGHVSRVMPRDVRWAWSGWTPPTTPSPSTSTWASCPASGGRSQAAPRSSRPSRNYTWTPNRVLQFWHQQSMYIDINTSPIRGLLRSAKILKTTS